LEGEEQSAGATTRVLSVTEAEQSFRFSSLPSRPVLSPLRGFSAPVRLRYERDAEQLAFLVAHDSDAFNRWDAAQELSCQAITARVKGGSADMKGSLLDACLLDSFAKVLANPPDDLSFLALLLSLPSEEYVSARLDVIDPDAVHSARQSLRMQLATALHVDLERLYQSHHRDEPTRIDSAAVGCRRVKNTSLGYLMALETDAAYRLCSSQFESATGMTDQIAALSLAVNSRHPARQRYLDAFYTQWRREALVIDKWFAIQASCSLPGTLADVEALMRHDDFDLKTPNRVRSLIGMFSQSNPVNFHSIDGTGYVFAADQIIALNALNPQIAARLAGALTQWRRYGEVRGALIRVQLERIAGTEGISKDVYEVASKSLA
jgi:aminopeptidase N